MMIDATIASLICGIPGFIFLGVLAAIIVRDVRDYRSRSPYGADPVEFPPASESASPEVALGIVEMLQGRGGKDMVPAIPCAVA